MVNVYRNENPNMDPVVTPKETESLVNGHLLEFDTKGSPVDPDIISN